MLGIASTISYLGNIGLGWHLSRNPHMQALDPIANPAGNADFLNR